MNHSTKYVYVHAYELVKSPRAFHYQRVAVEGDFWNCFEHFRLGAIWLQPRKRTKWMGIEKDQKYFGNATAVVVGVYTFCRSGHLRMYAGELQAIWAIYSLEMFQSIPGEKLVDWIHDLPAKNG